MKNANALLPPAMRRCSDSRLQRRLSGSYRSLSDCNEWETESYTPPRTHAVFCRIEPLSGKSHPASHHLLIVAADTCSSCQGGKLRRCTRRGFTLVELLI